MKKEENLNKNTGKMFYSKVVGIYTRIHIILYTDSRREIQRGREKTEIERQRKRERGGEGKS